MSDAFRTVTSGERFRPSARAWNALMKLAQAYEGGGMDPTGMAALGLSNPAPVLVQNDSGADRDEFDVLGIDSALVLPSDGDMPASQFKSVLAVKGVTPVDPDHLGRFVVLAGPVKAGAIGRGYIAGACPAKINVQDADHLWAEIKDGEVRLQSAASGSAVILWRESGTGEKWAIIHLAGALPPVLFPVLVTKDGGSAGDADTDCSFTYTVKDLAGFELETALAPECGRLPKTEYSEPSADSPAVAYRDSAGDLHLYHVAGELPVTKTVEVVTSFRYDTATHAFQLKKTAIRILEKADEDAEWTDVVSLTECDDT
ncbi:MAG: hypothetical protein JXL80_18270 [Planctomycetes bacterium]|nr:hypothetical protein [Planctomycetota bacterium]